MLNNYVRINSIRSSFKRKTLEDQVVICFIVLKKMLLQNPTKLSDKTQDYGLHDYPVV
jgi:hypothetical protein